MYCESTAAQYPMDSENHKLASTMVMDFWGRVTPGILQMLNTPKEVCVTDRLCGTVMDLSEKLSYRVVT